jgi:hypothetical protein
VFFFGSGCFSFQILSNQESVGRPLENNHPRMRELVGFDRSAVQFNLRRNPVFLLDDYPLPFAVNHLFFISVRVIHNARNEVRNEESCGVINPDCSGTACFT